jgi:hypothetical protein
MADNVKYGTDSRMSGSVADVYGKAVKVNGNDIKAL